MSPVYRAGLSRTLRVDVAPILTLAATAVSRTRNSRLSERAREAASQNDRTGCSRDDIGLVSRERWICRPRQWHEPN
jgi:hypothetical protein